MQIIFVIILLAAVLAINDESRRRSSVLSLAVNELKH